MCRYKQFFFIFVYFAGMASDSSCNAVRCTDKVMKYCLGPQFINDHCWCELGHSTGKSLLTILFAHDNLLINLMSIKIENIINFKHNNDKY